MPNVLLYKICEDQTIVNGHPVMGSTFTCQYVQVPAISNAVCNIGYGGAIPDSMICAGYPGVGGKAPCFIDNGGPFVCNEGGKAVLTGVVSGTASLSPKNCGSPQKLPVFARVTHVLDWIKSHMVSCEKRF